VIKVALAEILSSLEVVISSISLFRELRGQSRTIAERNSDAVNFLKNWEPLLEQLKFSKEVHDNFQDFENNFGRFLLITKDKSPQAISAEWENLVKTCYQRRIDDIIKSLPESDGIQTVQVNESEIPLSIRPNVKLVSGQYQRLIESLRVFAEKYEIQEADMNDQRFRDFEQYNTDLKRSTTDVLGRADKMILNLVPILIDNYDTVTSGVNQ
jgi:hypothetical protein